MAFCYLAEMEFLTDGKIVTSNRFRVSEEKGVFVLINLTSLVKREGGTTLKFDHCFGYENNSL